MRQRLGSLLLAGFLALCLAAPAQAGSVSFSAADLEGTWEIYFWGHGFGDADTDVTEYTFGTISFNGLGEVTFGVSKTRWGDSNFMGQLTVGANGEMGGTISCLIQSWDVLKGRMNLNKSGVTMLTNGRHNNNIVNMIKVGGEPYYPNPDTNPNPNPTPNPTPNPPPTPSPNPPGTDPTPNPSPGR